MKYITGIHALNIPCSLLTSGDWHMSAIRWEHPTMMDTDTAFFGNLWIEQHKIPPDFQRLVPVANHIRACLDLLELRDYINLQGMKEDYICHDDYQGLIFSQVLKMRSLPYWKEISRFMESEYFMDWVRFCRKVEREEHIDGLARKPLCRCITEAVELRRRYRRMTREQRCEAAREAIYGLMPQNDLRLPSLVALCILINEYHEDMEDDILCSLRTYLCYQPSEKFEYIVTMEAGPEIDRAWLSESFLSMFRTLGVRIEAQEERRCRSVVNG